MCMNVLLITRTLKFSGMSKRILLGLFAVCCGVSAMAQPTRGQMIDHIVARVDNYIILQSELEMGYENFVANGNTPNANTRCELLQGLVMNKVMVAKAEIDSVEVSEDRVLSQLEYNLSVVLQQIGSEERLEELYGKTIEEYREDLYDDMKENLTIQEMQRVITEGINVTPREVKRFYERIPRDSLPFYSTEVIVGQFVKKPTTSTREDARVRNMLLGFKKQIENGEATFEDLAAKHSEDPGSARRGGNLGFVSRGNLVPEYEAAAMSMKPGEISDPVKSQFGYHMIQLIERRGNQFNSRHILVRPRSGQADMEEAFAYLDSVRTRILADSAIRFEKLAKEYSEETFTASNGGYFVNPNVGGLRISVKELDPSVFFTIDTMRVGIISPPVVFETPEGETAARIIYYKERVPPHQANLADDYQKIKAAVLASKKNDALMEWFEEARKEVFIYVDPEYQNCRILN